VNTLSAAFICARKPAAYTATGRVAYASAASYTISRKSAPQSFARSVLFCQSVMATNFLAKLKEWIPINGNDII
jgi:hypothetical protein